MQKVVINHSTTYAGSQGPSASAYVTYQRAEDALRAIHAVNNIHVDGRVLKASLGTTKYCSHFMKIQSCPKTDCMYLHELGDESASFTKEEMQQGKHQEFEKKLQEQYLGFNSIPEKLSDVVCSAADGLNCDAISIPGTTDCSSVLNGDGVKKSVSRENIPTKNSSHLSDEAKEGWPALGGKEAPSKRIRTKSERSSARQTPTDENHKRSNKEKKAKKEKENEVPPQEAFLSSSSGDSCNSSASTTPPPSSSSPSTQSQDTPPLPSHSLSTPPSSPPLQPFSPSIPDTSPPLPSSSPLPVSSSSQRDSSESPAETTPSSLSSCSDFSCSIPSAHPPSLLEATDSSLFSSSTTDHSSRSFFSSNGMSQQPSHEQQIADENTIIFTDTFVNREINPINPDYGIRSCEENMFMSVADSCSNNNTWNSLLKYDASDINNESVIETRADDELGFDPFEETHKALAEDILLEQEQQQKRNYLIRQQQLLQQEKQHQLMQLKNRLDGYSTMKVDQPQARLPPPGFNPNSSMGFSTNQMPPPQQHHQQQQSLLNKLMPQYIGQQHQQQQVQQTLGGPLTNSQLNGLMASNKLGVPPGLSGGLSASMLNGAQSSNPSALHMAPGSAGPSLLLENPLGLTNQHHAVPPPGISLAHKQQQIDPFHLKDLENGLNSSMRGMYSPALSSVSTMNTVNTLNTLAAGNPQTMNTVNPQTMNTVNSLNTLAAGNPQTMNTVNSLNTLAAGNPQTNQINNFFNLAQEQRMQENYLTQHRNLFQLSQQQTLLQHITSNMMSAAPKVPQWGNGAATDLSAIDPAIVSSGQLTDSRSDSPPHWMKSVERLTNEQQANNSSWGSTNNTMLPYNLLNGGANNPSMWAPTSPPPGFNNISPLHHAKQRDSHKIENV